MSLSKLEFASLNEDATQKASKLVTVITFKNKFENKNLSDSLAPKETKEFDTTNSPETSKKGAKALTKPNMIDSKTLRKIGSSTFELNL